MPAIRNATSLVILAVLACGVAEDRTAAMQDVIVRRDSAGIEIVEIPAVQLQDLPHWRFAPEPIVSIGAAEGEEPYLLSRVQAAGRLESGEILVADGQTRELRVFDDSGRFLRSFGGPGEGPGEFRYWMMLSAVHNDRIAVFDPGLLRVTIYHLQSGLVSTARACMAEGLSREGAPCNVMGLFTEGVPVVTMSASAPRATMEPGLTEQQGVALDVGIEEDGRFRTVESLPGTRTVRVIDVAGQYWSTRPLFGWQRQTAFGAVAMVVGISDRWELRLRDVRGALVRIIRAAQKPTPVTEDLVAPLRRWADTASNAMAGARTYLTAYEPDGHVPFFEDLRIDRVGRIWVQDYRPPRILGGPRHRDWTILDPDGTPLARLEGEEAGDILENRRGPCGGRADGRAGRRACRDAAYRKRGGICGATVNRSRSLPAGTQRLAR